MKGYFNYIHRTHPVISVVQFMMFAIAITKEIWDKEYISAVMLIIAIGVNAWAYYQGYKLDRAMFLHRLMKNY